MIVDVISIASGLISIGLAIYAICFAKKESTQSTENYRRSKELLEEIKKVVYSNKEAIGYTDDQLIPDFKE